MPVEQTVKCHICGKLYVFMPFYAGDQSACPSCVARARANMRHPWRPTGDRHPGDDHDREDN